MEQQSLDQSKLLASQTEQLNSLKKGMLDARSRKEKRIESVTDDSETSQYGGKRVVKKSPNLSYSRLLAGRKKEEKPPRPESREEVAKESSLARYEDEKKSLQKPAVARQRTTKAGNKYASLDESGRSESGSPTETESQSEEEDQEETEETSETSAASRTESTNDGENSEAESPKVAGVNINGSNWPRKRGNLIFEGFIAQSGLKQNQGIYFGEKP